MTSVARIMSQGNLQIALLALVTLSVAVVGLLVGAAPVGLADVLGAIASLGSPATADRLVNAVVFDVRLPRVALGLVVGAGLAVAGALMQALFRNPLAEPSLVGVSSGAAAGAAAAIVFGSSIAVPEELRAIMVPVSAAVGGTVVTFIVQRVANVGGRTAVGTLLLAGLALTSLVNAGLGLALHTADDAQLRNLTFWLLGSLGGTLPAHVGLVAPIILVPVVLALRLAAPLDALLLGEAEARHLGVNVERLKKQVILLAATMVGAAVAMSGVIGFVGLIVPHLVRLVHGPGHGALLPRAALLGGALLVVADSLARTLVAPAELPIGVLTALVGAPFFLWLLLRKDGKVGV